MVAVFVLFATLAAHNLLLAGQHDAQPAAMTQDGEMVCAHFRVRGQVQGVFFRASTEAMARRLELKGWVRNVENGDVELVACGAAQQIQELENWLWQGSAEARVTGVQRTPVPFQTFNGFEVRR